MSIQTLTDLFLVAAGLSVSVRASRTAAASPGATRSSMSD